ncbi:hypothetical protein H2199_007278 [Coniosporium tulheliwenetii]|uniref:Uncharacterized protein n=1 Tax=Coniosporium tulheliwenetii TaxID=3383036 RepID=A0ACC2YQU8_9PEZI|nr:hypothetical protein H2199_007278 [Cladosporium sp. JES 115]
MSFQDPPRPPERTSSDTSSSGSSEDGERISDQGQPVCVADHAGRKKSEEDKEVQTTGPDKILLEERWLDVLGLHLVCEPSFFELMIKPPRAECISLSRSWLAAVHLQNRYANYNGFKNWKKRWFQPNRQEVVRRAIDYYEKNVITPSLKLEIFTRDLKQQSKEDENRCYSLFLLQKTRLAFVAAHASCTDLELHLITKIWSSGGKDSDIDRIQRLRAFKSDVHNIAKTSKLDQKGIELLGRWIKNIGTNGLCGVLYELPEDETISKIETSKYELDADRFADRIMKEAQFTPEYHCGWRRGSYSPLLIIANEGARGKTVVTKPKADRSDEHKVESKEKLLELDENLAKELNALCESPFIEALQEVYEALEIILERPPQLLLAYSKRDAWTGDKDISRLSLLFFRDNVYHCRRLMNELRRWEMFVESDGCVQWGALHYKMKRLFLLLAVIHVGFPMPAMWLTIMDALLDDLGLFVLGHADEDYDLSAMRHIARMDAETVQRLPSKQRSTEPTATTARARKEATARDIFQEFCRYFRSAVLMSVAATSIKSDDRDTDLRLWKTEFLDWFDKCKEPGCGSQVRVLYRTDDKVDLIMARPGSSFGFPAHAQMRDNSVPIHPCLLHIVSGTKFDKTLLPFYHYFAHEHHQFCKPINGKLGVMEDLSMVGEIISLGRDNMDQQEEERILGENLNPHKEDFRV